MRDSTSTPHGIYIGSLLVIAATFVVALALPYASSELKLFIFVFAVLVLYPYLGIQIYRISQAVASLDTGLEELKRLYISTATSFGSAYFFLAMIDSNQLIVRGLRAECALGDVCATVPQGFYELFKNTADTLMNALAYSVLVMATIGDSKIAMVNGLGRIFVAAEVAISVGMTVFKLGQVFSDQTTKEIQVSERRIRRDLRRINPDAFPKKRSCKAIRWLLFWR